MEARRAKLDKDLEEVVLTCEKTTCVEIKEVSSDSLVLLLKAPNDITAEYVFNFLAADYPDGTVVFCGGNVLETFCDRLVVIVSKIVTEWCNANNMETPMLFPDEQVSQSVPLDSQVSVPSSEVTEGSDVDMEDYYYDDYDGNDMESESEGINQLLEAEISQVQQAFGHNSVEYRVHAGIDEMDIFFNIDLNNFLDENTASAWGMKIDEPLVILLHIRTVSKYLDGIEPQVDVFQAPLNSKSDKRKVGVGSQMKKIMQTFITDQWKSLSNSKVMELLNKKTKVSPVAVDYSDDDSKDAKLTQLVEMGFSLDKSIKALSEASYDLSNACSLLLKWAAGDTNGTRREEKSAPKAPVRQQSLGAVVEAFGEDAGDDSLITKEVPPLDNGFLAQCVRYALNRICSLNEYCVICDERHVLETGLIKPCVCTRELCVFAFQTLGVMADAAEAIATDADVVDLLIAMANAAANSGRANLILDPYPSIVDPDKPDRLAMDPKNKDFELVKKVLGEVVLSRDRMLKGRTANIKDELDAHHKLAFSMMQWIIATCRAHIVLLPEDRQLKSMKTRYQFLLISSPPSKEAAFQHAKSKHGSTFAFHGSNIENWHSIMRRGLINASGTKYQLHGAAYGKGVYLSPVSSVSFGYTGYCSYTAKPKPPSSQDRESLAGKLKLRCLALCEVVTSKDLRRSGDVWVCPQSDHVCTRFFFVYDDVNNAAMNLDTRTPSFKKEIDHAVAHIKAFRTVTSKGTKKK